MDIQVELHERWIVFWWALSLSLITIGIAWRKGFFKSFSFSPLPEINGEDVARGFCLYLIVQLVLIPLIASSIFTLKGWSLNLPEEEQGWLNLYMVLGGFLSALVAYYFLTAEQRKQLWHQQSKHWLHHIGQGIGYWLVFFPVVLAVNQLLSILSWHVFHHPFQEQSVVLSLRQALEDPLLFWILALVIVTLVPFTEEYLFRGLLQTWLKRKFDRAWPAIILSSFIFALFHFTVAQGLTNIELLSSLFLLSCVLGFLFEKQHSLWAPIGLHSFFNLMSLLMILVAI